VRSGECVLPDAGSVGAARGLVESSVRDVIVVTNGLDCATVLEEALPRLTVILTGGTLQSAQRALVDPLADLILDRLRGHAMLLTCAGVAPGAGVTDHDLQGAAMKRRMLAAAARRVVVAGAVAVGAIERAQVCAIDDVDVVVTSAAADADALHALRDSGVEVVEV
jgi:DeoR family transcriptional regulator of aga operon